jgi:hypothetical protein
MSRNPNFGKTNIGMMNRAAATLEQAERERMEKDAREKFEAFKADTESRCIHVTLAGGVLAVYAETVEFSAKGFIGSSPITNGRTAIAFSSVSAMSIIDEGATELTREVYRELVSVWLGITAAEIDRATLKTAQPDDAEVADTPVERTTEYAAIGG